jgi:hypothetical protein
MQRIWAVPGVERETGRLERVKGAKSHFQQVSICFNFIFYQRVVRIFRHILLREIAFCSKFFG